MSRFTRFQKILLGITAGLLFFVMLSSQKPSPLSSAVYDAMIMLKYSVIDYPIETAVEWIDDFNSLWSVHEENEHLRYLLSQQKMNNAQLEEEIRKNKELTDLMNQKMEIEYEKVYARIVNRSAETWNNQITINVGEQDGIALNMAVVSSKGLIGKVIEVGPLTSKVRLLTSQDQLSKVAVKIAVNEEIAIEGYLEEYDLDKNSFKVRLFSDADEVENEMDVITSGVGGVFPSGILVGSVNEIVELKNEKGKIIYVTPAASFSSFEYVAVINEAGS